LSVIKTFLPVAQNKRPFILCLFRRENGLLWKFGLASIYCLFFRKSGVLGGFFVFFTQFLLKKPEKLWYYTKKTGVVCPNKKSTK